MKSNLNPLFEEWDGDDTGLAYAATGVSALVLRFFKLKQAKELFLSAYPTPKDLQDKLRPIMARNPAAREVYTKLDGMSQAKYIWWIKIKFLKSYNFVHILGNFLLGPLGIAKQGMDMVSNKYFETPGGMLNKAINTEKQVDKMYYK